MSFVDYFLQMSKAKKIGFIFCFLVVSQIVRLYLEGTYLRYPAAGQATKDNLVQRIMPGASEEIIADRFIVHRFYKSEGFGINDVNPYDVTLALHGSIDRLHELIGIAEVWKGPISMSVFAPGLDGSFLDDAIDGLRLCWNSLRLSASFHVVYPRLTPVNVTSVGSFVYLSCKDIIRRMKRKKPTGMTDESLAYPHNVMRNVARSGVMTHYVLHLDVGVIPTPRLRDRFMEYIKGEKKHTEKASRSSLHAYVLPVFEARHDLDPIRNKRDLVTALEDRNARPYMQETCPKCHKATGYERWQKSLSFKHGIKLNTSYAIDYVTNWEPFFIISRHSPLYDERITSYGYDRLTHMCKLQAAGFQFHVFNEEFLLYREYRTKNKISEIEKRRRDDRITFHNKFVQILEKFGYTGGKYEKCFR